MGTSSRFYPNLYKDSVSLMTVSARVTSIPGIEAASVVMASATNVDNLAQAGLGTFEVRPNDLVVAVSGTDEACDEALAVADKLLSAAPGDGGDQASAAAPDHQHPDGRRQGSGAQPRADLGARRLRRRRGDEGTAAGPGRHGVQRQRQPAKPNWRSSSTPARPT